MYLMPCTVTVVPGVERSIVLVMKNMSVVTSAPMIPALGRLYPTMNNIAARISVPPMMSEPRYGPNISKCHQIRGLLETRGIIPSAPGAVILNAPAQRSMTIMPMLVIRKGRLWLVIHVAIPVRVPFAAGSLFEPCRDEVKHIVFFLAFEMARLVGGVRGTFPIQTPFVARRSHIPRFRASNSNQLMQLNCQEWGTISAWKNGLKLSGEM